MTCVPLLLLLYVAPPLSLIALVLSVFVAHYATNQRIIIQHIQIKIVCLLDDFFQVLIPKGITSRLKKQAEEVVQESPGPASVPEGAAPAPPAV